MRYAVGLAAVALLAGACGDSDDGASGGSGGSGGSQIVVGVIDTLTGAAAYCGDGEVNGIRLAFDEAEAQGVLGDLDVDLVVEDDLGSAEGAVAAFQKILGKDPVAILGPCLSNVAEATSSMHERTGIPQILTTSGAAPLVEPELRFRTGIPQGNLAARTVDVLAARGVERLGMVIDAGNPTIVQVWDEVMKPALLERGIDVVVEERETAQTQDFSAHISKLLDADLDAIGDLLIGQDVTFITQLREAGYHGQVFGHYGMGNAAFLENAGSAADGTLFTVNFHPASEQPSTVAFVEAYTAEYGKAPDFAGANGYDSAWRLIRAIESIEGDVDAESILAALDEMSQMDGAQGSIEFTENGDATGDGLVLEIVDGDVVVVDEAEG